MVPTQERFEAVDPVAPDVNDGLVPDRQLAPVERIDELDPQLQTLEHLLAHAGLEHLEAALAATLGEVHRDVGIAHHGVDVVVEVGERDAHRGVLEDPQLGSDVGRLAHGLDGAAGNRGRDLRRRALEEDRELVAAEAGDGVARSQQGPETLGDDAQQAVTRGMPEAVVDRLEVVEVDAQHGRVRAIGLALRQRGSDAISEDRPVRQAGERVVGRFVQQAHPAHVQLTRDQHEPQDDEGEHHDRAPEQGRDVQRLVESEADGQHDGRRERDRAEDDETAHGQPRLRALRQGVGHPERVRMHRGRDHQHVAHPPADIEHATGGVGAVEGQDRIADIGREHEHQRRT